MTLSMATAVHWWYWPCGALRHSRLGLARQAGNVPVQLRRSAVKGKKIVALRGTLGILTRDDAGELVARSFGY